MGESTITNEFDVQYNERFVVIFLGCFRNVWYIFFVQVSRIICGGIYREIFRWYSFIKYLLILNLIVVLMIELKVVHFSVVRVQDVLYVFANLIVFNYVVLTTMVLTALILIIVDFANDFNFVIRR